MVILGHVDSLGVVPAVHVQTAVVGHAGVTVATDDLLGSGQLLHLAGAEVQDPELVPGTVRVELGIVDRSAAEDVEFVVEECDGVTRGLLEQRRLVL